MADTVLYATLEMLWVLPPLVTIPFIQDLPTNLLGPFLRELSFFSLKGLLGRILFCWICCFRHFCRYYILFQDPSSSQEQQRHPISLQGQTTINSSNFVYAGWLPESDFCSAASSTIQFQHAGGACLPTPTAGPPTSAWIHLHSEYASNVSFGVGPTREKGFGLILKFQKDVKKLSYLHGALHSLNISPCLCYL